MDVRWNSVTPSCYHLLGTKPMPELRAIARYSSDRPISQNPPLISGVTGT
jgi:hypothetical protein